MVKKILEDGSECKKCREVSERLSANDEMKFIDYIAYADVKNPESEGFLLANKHSIDTAPFFVVKDGNSEQAYKTYLQLRKNAFNKIPDREDQAIEDKRNNSNQIDDEMYYF